MTDKPNRAEATPSTDAKPTKGYDPRQQAGQDESIVERLARNPASPQAKLDRALDESMDASDPPSQTPPGVGGDPSPSSGFDEKAEAALCRK